MDEKIYNIEDFLIVRDDIPENARVGLITGCFDILHVGHVDLFRFSKEHIDILIVGVDTDISIKKTKGDFRPIHDQEFRVKMLSELNSVDYVIKLENNSSFNSNKSQLYYDDITRLISPTYLITSKYSDNYWKIKKERIEKCDGKLLLDQRKRNHSTTNIIDKIIERYK